MKPDPSKLRQETREQQSADLGLTQQHQTAVQFESVEKLIRHDAERTVVPPQIAERLNESIAREPKAAKPWWRRLFGSGP